MGMGGKRYRFMVQVKDSASAIDGSLSLLRRNVRPLDGRRWTLVQFGSRATHFPDVDAAEAEALVFRRHNTGWGTKVVEDMGIPAIGGAS